MCIGGNSSGNTKGRILWWGHVKRGNAQGGKYQKGDTKTKRWNPLGGAKVSMGIQGSAKGRGHVKRWEYSGKARVGKGKRAKGGMPRDHFPGGSQRG